MPQSNLLLAFGSRVVYGIARADRSIDGDLGRVLSWWEPYCVVKS